ncbi:MULTISPECIES: CU044_2847 family protein [unclassified Nostoc]|uniref:CU044_2847 family protein n=1 Tax=unclassified Nostoc TaxID=2593658 RepID=UPI002AD30F57|nr:MULTISPECIES: CU044_2847 family protein [unclassified Nostoc]MDZ8031445.1 CU044_2847 family protein [Nostoc sp. DedSLP04]MDZ8094989.1 CU044_2847 family protein [Nostoc sp. DedQUE05]MDZ8129348.1 CU044_2847 family protein [Nostoc sp. DedQUE07]MDZ8140575.1 CU044_2847 family protein [Nostoc sp. DedQUE04]
MSEVQQIFFQADGEIEQIEINVTATEITSEIEEDDDGIEYKDVRTDAIARMQQARQMIRSYTIYALSAFKDFNTADIEEVSLKFGIKLGGKAGIPYITEGSAESNLEIQVKCKFPEKPKPDSQ